MAQATGIEVRQLLHRFGMERDRLRAVLAQRTGLTMSDLDALEFVEAEGPQTQRALADRLLLTSGGVTVLVDRLERGGWVRRSQHPSDRRAVLVELNPEMPVANLQPLVRYHEAIEAAARRLAAHDRSTVASFLGRAVSLAAEATDDLRVERPEPNSERR